MPRNPTPLQQAKAEAREARSSMALLMAKYQKETDQKDLILGRMNAMVSNLCDAMAQLSEFPMDQKEVDRLRKICDVMLDLRRAMVRFATEHDDLIHGIRSRPGREFIRRPA
jgi:beta-mannanase